MCDFDYLKSLIIPFSTFECAFFFKLVISVNRSLGRRKNKISFYDAETEMCPLSRHDFVFHENVFGKQFNSMLDFGAVWKTENGATIKRHDKLMPVAKTFIFLLSQ